MSVHGRGDLIQRLSREMQRSTMYTVLLHHATSGKAGINVTDAQCINMLVLDGSQTPGQLAQGMGITTGGAITAVIDRLEKAGYVKRTRDPDDRRRVIVELVPDKVARLSAFFEPVGRSFGARMAELSDEQLRFLLDWWIQSNQSMPTIIQEIQNLP